MHNKKNLILEIQDLSLAFPKTLYQSTSLRDSFINVLSGKRILDNDQHVVLNKLNLNIWSGDRVGILAKNGTGKSTLCRCISGYYKPRDGIIKRYGLIRALFESSLAFYPELSGRENMKILAEIFYDYKTDNLQEIIEESIIFSELNESIDAPLKTYSKGMQLRLSLSLLSALSTDLLILDEVFDGADEFFRKKLATRVRNLIDSSSSVILVSHQESQIMEICNRVLVMKDGQFIFDGDPLTAFEVYRSGETGF